MKISKNDSAFNRSRFLIITAIITVLAVIAQACTPAPQETDAPPENTPLPPSPSSTPVPQPTVTPTLALIDEGIVFLVVGLSPDQTLPIYHEPSLSALQTGQIPGAGKNIRTTGNAHENDGLQWLQIEYQGSGGWVDYAHLASQKGDLPEALVELAQSAALAIKGAVYSDLGEIIHPDLCLRFSPYPFLRDGDQIFCPEQLSSLPGSSTLYLWGKFDGTGEPIELSFDDYHQRFVYDQDFSQPAVVGLNQEVSSGNAINNIPEIYPDGMIVEYHFPGFEPQYVGMDWRSLRMVFIQEGGEWFLVALVHGEWTI